MSEQLKKSTRYLLVNYQKRAGFKPFYRRGGQRFDHNRESLVDVMETGPENAQRILDDRVLNVQQLTEKSAEKYHRLLEKRDEEKHEVDASEVLAQAEALKKARKQYTDERERADTLERQNAELIESLNAAELRTDELERRVGELSAMVELLQEDGAGDDVETQS